MGFYEPVSPAASAGAGRAPPENSAPACAQLFAEHSPSPQTKPPLPPLGSQGFSAREQGVSPRPFRLPIASFRDAARLPRRILKYGTIASPLGAALVPFLCLAAQLQLCHRRTSNQNPILFSQNAVDPASSRPGPDLSLHSVRQHASPLTESSNTPPSPPARCGGPSGRVAGSTGSWFGAAPVSPPPAWPGRRAARPGAGG